MKPIREWSQQDLTDELLHFQELASLILPRGENVPVLPDIDYFGFVEPYKGCVGGDHLVFVDFRAYKPETRIKLAQEAGAAALASGNDALAAHHNTLAANLAKNLDRFGILVADASGHMTTDNTILNYFHGAFTIGVGYEFLNKGEVTPELFEMLNMMLYKHINPREDYLKNKPYMTLLYGEVHNSGRFRFLSAGHPLPLVFSYEFNRIERSNVDPAETSTPLGVLPSNYHADIERFDVTFATKDDYSVGERRLLAPKDFMIIYTDGLSEQQSGTRNFCEERLEGVLREVKDESARGIYEAIRRELYKFCPPDDDWTAVVVKRK
jgi:hypothetical protein